MWKLLEKDLKIKCLIFLIIPSFLIWNCNWGSFRVRKSRRKRKIKEEKLNIYRKGWEEKINWFSLKSYLSKNHSQQQLNWLQKQIKSQYHSVTFLKEDQKFLKQFHQPSYLMTQIKKYPWSKRRGRTERLKAYYFDN